VAENEPAQTAATSPYTQLASVGPYDVRIGSALITMVEPHVGHEVAYNRWYEDDHFYAGAMAMPWMFAGRRYVATTDLQALRLPRTGSAVADPIELGKYIAIYWINTGRYQEHLRWSLGINNRLLKDGRVYLNRDHIFTAFQEHITAVYRDQAGPRDIHAFDHPHGGLVVEVVDADEGSTIDGAIDYIRRVRAPKALQAGAIMGVLFTPIPLPEDRMSYVKQVEGLGRRVTVLWFTEGDVRDSWEGGFAQAVEQAQADGVGTCQFVAPFQPTVPGTNKYTDQLR
jgi:hypothetical protein